MKARNAELAPTPRGVSVDKIEKFGWRLVDDPGELRMIDKNALGIDPEYQRDASPGRVRAIASAWSWVACGAITVANRDGKLWVIDGQHRVMAARSRSDIRALPCIVFETAGRTEEAMGFYRLNTGKPMSSIETFKALLCGGDEVAAYVQAALVRHGLMIGKRSEPGYVRCIKTLSGIAARSRDDFDKVLRAADAVCWRTSHIHERIVVGIDYIHQHCGEGLDDKRLYQRLVDAGAVRLLAGIGRAAAYFSKGGARVYAEGILAVLNKGLRVKFELDSAADEIGRPA